VLALLGLVAVLLVVFSIRSYVFPIHPWAVRRLVPVVMPTLALTTAAVLTVGDATPDLEFLSIPRRSLSWGVTGLSVIAIASLATSIGQRSLPILFHRERAGLWRQLEAVSETFPDDAVLLFDNGNVSQGLTQAMELIFGRTSLVIQQSPPTDTDSEVDKVIEDALDQTRSVYLIVTNGDLEWWPEQWGFVQQGAFEIQVPVLRQPEERRPEAEDVVTQTLLLDIYQIRPSADLETTGNSSGIIEVPAAGAGSYPYLRGGFHNWYKDAEGRTTRWTDGRAVIMMPWPASQPGATADFCLTVDLAGGRPADEEPVYLSVMAEGEELFSDQLSRAFSSQRLMIPAVSVENENRPELEIRLISTTWEASSVGDERVLGVLFYGIELAPLEQCTSS
jgi:hypothetical protein